MERISLPRFRNRQNSSLGSKGSTGRHLRLPPRYSFFSFRWPQSNQNALQSCLMAKPRDAQYRRCDARLLREMSRAVRSFDRSRGKQRVEALRRYISAITEFSRRVTYELPPTQRRKRPAPRHQRNRGITAGFGNRRLTSGLISYLGEVGAYQVLASASLAGGPPLPAVKSVLGVFLGNRAASQLIDRLIDRAR